MKNGEGAAAKRAAVRKTVRLSAETMDIVEAYRRSCNPIPSFSKAVNDLIGSGKKEEEKR
jgi:hypothetical protein